jgi:hypothetical protein
MSLETLAHSATPELLSSIRYLLVDEDQGQDTEHFLWELFLFPNIVKVEMEPVELPTEVLERDGTVTDAQQQFRSIVLADASWAFGQFKSMHPKVRTVLCVTSQRNVNLRLLLTAELNSNHCLFL